METGSKQGTSPLGVSSRDKSSSREERATFVGHSAAMLVVGEPESCHLQLKSSREARSPTWQDQSAMMSSQHQVWLQSRTWHSNIHIPNGLHILTTERLKAVTMGDHHWFLLAGHTKVHKMALSSHWRRLQKHTHFFFTALPFRVLGE